MQATALQGWFTVDASNALGVAGWQSGRPTLHTASLSPALAGLPAPLRRLCDRAGCRNSQQRRVSTTCCGAQAKRPRISPREWAAITMPQQPAASLFLPAMPPGGQQPKTQPDGHWACSDSRSRARRGGHHGGHTRSDKRNPPAGAAALLPVSWLMAAGVRGVRLLQLWEGEGTQTNITRSELRRAPGGSLKCNSIAAPSGSRASCISIARHGSTRPTGHGVQAMGARGACRK